MTSLVDSTLWNELRKEYLELKEKLDVSPMVRWSVYALEWYEIQGSQGQYLMLRGDEESLDDLCDYIISKEELLNGSIIILKEHAFPDGRRHVEGGQKYDNNCVYLRNSTDPIYSVSSIEGYLKKKNSMILRPIQSFDAHSEKETPEVKKDSKRSIIYLFPGDEEEEEEEEEDYEKKVDSDDEEEEEDDIILY